MSVEKLLKEQGYKYNSIKNMTDPEFMQEARSYADTIISYSSDISLLRQLEQKLSFEVDPNVFVAYTLKLAISKLILMSDPKKRLISIVIPMYHEGTRMQRKEENEFGEDFLRQKYLQLEWLFKGSNKDYVVTLIDDQCNDDPPSGVLAEAIINGDPLLRSKFYVNFLGKAIENKANIDDEVILHSLDGATIPKSTVKAAAVEYGMALSCSNSKSSNDIIVTTDADLSVDLGQIGLLLDAFVNNPDTLVAAGSRRLQKSVMLITADRNIRAQVARYLRETLFGRGFIPLDTQCGFKAWSPDCVRRLIKDGNLCIRGFSFDVELLLKVRMMGDENSITPIPICWFDSAEMTTTNPSTHRKLIEDQAKLAQKLYSESPEKGKLPHYVNAIDISLRVSAKQSVWDEFLNVISNNQELVSQIREFNPLALGTMNEILNSINVT